MDSWWQSVWLFGFFFLVGNQRLSTKLYPVGNDIEVLLVVDLDAAIDQDLPAFGNIFGSSLTSLAEYGHGEESNLLFTVVYGDVKGGEFQLPTLGI